MNVLGRDIAALKAGLEVGLEAGWAVQEIIGLDVFDKAGWRASRMASWLALHTDPAVVVARCTRKRLGVAHRLCKARHFKPEGVLAGLERQPQAGVPRLEHEQGDIVAFPASCLVMKLSPASPSPK